MRIPQKVGNNFTTIFIAIISTLRLFISSIAGTIAATVYYATTLNPSMMTALITFAVVVLTSGFGFALNDYIDLDKDKINHTYRALPSGKLSRRQVLLLIPILVIVSIYFSFLLNSLALFIDIIVIALLSVYSFVNNKYGIWANAITALTSSFTIIFGMSVGNFSLPLLFSAMGAFFLIFAREIILDIRDFVADKAWGKTSVPIRFGIVKAVDISMSLLGVSSLIFVVSATTWGTASFILFVGVILNGLLWVGFLYYRFHLSISAMERFLILTRIAFLCLLPALLL
ncbi:MAG: UbiA family prenyltransferase [Ignavibacteriales bacterium]|nr:UbiA family prenyltransferase [Ignavibacteriales bacterium]